MSHVLKTIKCLSALVVALMLMSATLPAYAMTECVDVGLSIRQTFNNHTNMDVEDTFTYVLTPLETGNPMPAQSKDSYSFTMEGTKELRLADIVFTKPNIYRYELKQNIVSEKKGYMYDGEVYTVEVYVTTDQEGKLSANTIVYTNSHEKAEEISFENGYEEKQDILSPSQPIHPPQTGDDTNIMLYLAILLTSGMCFIIVLLIGKKKRG